MNTRILIDGTAKPSKEQASQFTELPTNKQAHEMLVLGADVQSGMTTGATKKETSAPDDLPEKFKGKTAKEIAQAHAELEKKLGSQGQEIGQLRALADKLLELKRTEDLTNAGGAKKPVQIESDALLRDPRGAIEQVAKETTADLEKQVAQMRMALIEQQFTARHPTFREDMNDTDFQEYVRKSPYRQNLAAKAKEGDIGAADELFSGWEEVKAGAKAPDQKDNSATPEAKEQARQKALKDAAMVSGGSGNADVAQASKPIYSRQALIRKRMDDPTGYYDEAFQAIIMEAYREGRVK